MGYYAEALSKYGTKVAAARASGLAVSTFKDRLSAEILGIATSRQTISSPTAELSAPIIPDDLPPIDEILRRMQQDYDLKAGKRDAAEWMEIKVRDNLPFGLMLWGDPHIDSPGCDISLIRHHMALSKHPSVFSLNIGDTLDGWVGRLVKLYEDSRVDIHSARELAKWLLREVRWFMWLVGNHDSWSHNQAILRLMSEQAGVQLMTWAAKFQVVFPNGNRVRVHAAHDFPGRSMHNILHGNMRAARYMSDADLFLSGHLHDWGSSAFEMAGFGRVVHSVRVRGYKMMDEYALTNGFQSSKHGSSCLIIIDPNMEGPGRIMPCWDIRQGIDMLDGLIRVYKGGHRATQDNAEALRVGSPAATPAGRKQAVRRARKADRKHVAGVRAAGRGAAKAARGKGRRGAGKAGA